MSRDQQPLENDHELVELFKDDPGGLAIVDAIASTQHQRRTRRPARAIALVAAVVIGAVAVGALTRSDSQAGVVESALAALPTDRVLHLVLEDEQPGVSVVNLQTGRSSPAPHIVSEWFDLRSGTRRVRDLIAGVAVSDVRVGAGNSPITASPSPTTIGRFPALYRKALAQATNADVTRRTVDGASVFWLRFPRSRTIDAVAINRKTFRPSVIVLRNGRDTHQFRVRKIESLPPSASVPPTGPTAHPLTSHVAESIPSNAEAASETWLAARTFGRHAAGLPLLSVRALRFSNGNAGVELLFGDSSAKGRLPNHFVRVQESSGPEGHFGWSQALVHLARPSVAVVEQDGKDTNVYLTESQRFIRVLTSEGRQAALLLAHRIVAS